MASMAIVGVSFCGRGGTNRGLGGGVDERRAGSRVALGNTAARGAEFGAEVGGASPLGGVLGEGVLGTLDVGRLTIAFGNFPSASAAVVLDIQGYCEGREPVGSVGGGLDASGGGGKLGVFGATDVEGAFMAGFGAIDDAPDTGWDGSEGRNGAAWGLGGVDEDRIEPMDGSNPADLTAELLPDVPGVADGVGNRGRPSG